MPNSIFLFYSSFSSLRTKSLELLLLRQEILGPGLAGLAAKDKHGRQLPVGGDVPRGGDTLVNKRVVVLQVGTEALGLERGPHGELQHAGRLGGPGGEAVGVEGVLFLHAVDDLLVFVEEHLFWEKCQLSLVAYCLIGI